MENHKIIFFLLFTLFSIENSFSQKSNNKSKDQRGLLPELQSNSADEDENEDKNLRSEVLISRTEAKAIKALESILQKKKGTAQEPDLLNRLAELYMRRSKSGRFFDLQRDNKSHVLSSFPIPDEKGTDSVKKAVTVYNKILTQFPKYKEYDSVLFNSAFALQQLNQKKQSEINYKNLIEKFPNSSLLTDTLLALGELLYDQGRFLEAKEYFEKIEKYPESRVYSYGIYKLAWSYYNLKKTDQAIKKLKDVIASNPPTEDASNKKGYYLRKEALRDMVLFIGEVYTADELYSFFKKLATNEELGPSLFDMAKLYDSYSRLKDIHIFLNEFIEKEPLNSYVVRSHLLLADTFETLKKRDLVIFHFTKASELCRVGTEWRLHQSEEEVKSSCFTEFRRDSLEIAKKWWEIWQKNKNHKEFSALTEKILRLVLENESVEDPDLKTRLALAELLFQNENYEESYEQYNTVSLKAKDEKIAHDSTYGALFSKEKSIEKEKTETKSIQRKEVVQRYIQKFPKGEYIFPVSMKLAVLYYEEKNYEDSLKILTPLAVNKSNMEIKLKAEDLILDIKNIEKKYSEIKTLSQSYLNESKDDKRVQSLKKIYEESHYSEIQENNKKLDPYSAAKNLYDYSKLHPRTEIGKDAFLQGIALMYTQHYLWDAAEMSEEFLMQNPSYEKKVDLLKDIASSYAEIGKLDKAAKVLLDLSGIDTKNKWSHLENAADFLILDNNQKEARKIYHQLLLEYPKEKRLVVFNKIKNSLNDKTDIKEIEKINKIILEQNIEPFATEILTKRAQMLFEEKKYSDCYELTIKIIKRDSESSARAEAKYLQARIFENELISQSVKTTSENRLGIVIQLKTEKLDKTQTAYLSVTKMTQDKRLLYKVFQGIDRSLENYIDSIKKLPPPPSLSENDVTELKKQLTQIVKPLEEKKEDNLKQINSFAKFSSGESIDWQQISIEEVPKLQFLFPQYSDLNPLIPENWPLDKNELQAISLSSTKKNKSEVSLPQKDLLKLDTKELLKLDTKTLLKQWSYFYTQKNQVFLSKINDVFLKDPKKRVLGLYLLSLSSELNDKFLKSQWLIEKIRKTNPDIEALLNYQTHRITLLLDHKNLNFSFTGVKDSNFFEFNLFLAINYFLKEDFTEAKTVFEKISDSVQKSHSQKIKELVYLLWSESLLNLKEYEKSIDILNTFDEKKWQDKESYYFSLARIHEKSKKSLNLSIKFYELTQKESNSTDKKEWITRKLIFLKRQILEKDKGKNEKK